MTKFIALILPVFLLIACTNGEPEAERGESSTTYLPAVTTAAADRGDVVYTNGSIYTVNPEQPWADAVAIRDGLILAVGDEADVLAEAGNDATVIDLDGAMMLPGFQDPHLHVLEAGLNENLCLVSDVAEFDEYIDEILDCADQQPESEWVRAAGANMADLLHRERLPIDVLDEAVPDRPAIILDDLGHGAWLNTLAMQVVGYDSMDSDPPGGILVRDPKNDKLTGLVLENAQQAARTASLPPTPDNLELAYQGLLTGLATVAENGITTVSDAGGYWPRGHHTVWQRALDEGTLSVRANNALYVFPDRELDEQLAEFEKLYANDPDSLLRFAQAKIYIDGILSQGTGALLRPYDSSFEIPAVPDDGFLYFDTDVLHQYVRQLDELGFQLHFHVTGDRGARIALDAIEATAETNGPGDRRQRLTHLYLIDPADRDRFAEQNVVADFQFAPSSTDDENAEFMAPYIGDRVDQLLPLFDMVERDATVVLSSDWDADLLSPLEKIQSVLAQDEENVLTLDDLIRMTTLGVAYLLHQDESTGSIEPGKQADLIVLDRNLFDIPVRQIGQAQVLLTLLSGQETYRRPE